jgi:tetratricopeptide (TPR) repeat protein
MFGVIALFAVTVWALVRKPTLGFLGVWFFVILSPTSSFVPIADVAAEHRMYLSLAAVVVLVVLAIFRAGRSIGTAVGGVAALALGVATYQRNLDYRSEVAIWQDTVNKCPGNPRAHYNYGVALENVARLAEAIPHYQEALRIKPDYAEAYNNLGNVQLQAGKLPDATKNLQQAVRFNPNLAEAHYNLGNALAQSGKFPEAIGHYEQALRIKPGYAEVHNNWGIVLSQAGKLQEARAHYEAALRIKPHLPEAHNNLGYDLQQTGHLREAIAHYEEAVRAKPDYLQALNNLALTLAIAPPAQGGEPTRAISIARQVCDLTASRVPAYLNTLAMAHAAAGQFNDAATTAQQALELARAAGQAQLAGQIAARLASYRESRSSR